MWQVIKSDCTPASPYMKHMHGADWVTDSMTASESQFAYEEEARRLAVPEKGKCITLRPVFNEKDEHGRFFREWRSFDGGELKEVRWYF